jgi:bifunctional DNA-binding transcriptional regulator/antitoxin component of YhaV-PrlF toxin-antitoxin module
LKGNPIGPNKSKLKTRCLALAKVIVGVVPSDWREVSDAKKKDIWEILQQEFGIPSYHKENVLTQLADQWKTWKKNIRKRYFGSTGQEILALKDKVPVKEQITVAAWNKFIEHEATPQKLEQRKRNKLNREKKTDVHLLGAKSYSDVYSEWQVYTWGYLY